MPYADSFSMAIKAIAKKPISFCTMAIPLSAFSFKLSSKDVSANLPIYETPSTENDVPIINIVKEESKQAQEADYFLSMMKQQVQLAREVDLELLKKESKFNEIYLLVKPERRVIIFDLDETLIFNDGKEIHLRPFLEPLLDELSVLFEIWIWSAADMSYVLKAVEMIDPFRIYIGNILDKSYCTDVGNKLVKDMRIFANVDLENMVLVDNYLFSFVGSLNNGVLVQSYNGGDNDNELDQLRGFLMQMTSYSSMKDALMENLKMSSYFD